jgi:hypothetical protein
MWDYIGARPPVLAVATLSFRVHEFVDSLGIGLAVSPDDPNEIAEAIRAVKRGHSSTTPKNGLFPSTPESTTWRP